VECSSFSPTPALHHLSFHGLAVGKKIMLFPYTWWYWKHLSNALKPSRIIYMTEHNTPHLVPRLRMRGAIPPFPIRIHGVVLSQTQECNT
jgi:hypothetical protein